MNGLKKIRDLEKLNDLKNKFKNMNHTKGHFYKKQRYQTMKCEMTKLI